MTSLQIRNATSIYDNDMLNMACECEMKENVLDAIATAICEYYKVDTLYKNNIFSFEVVSDIMSKYGFNYTRCDFDNEEHVFTHTSKGWEISVYPVIFYPRLGYFRFQNIGIC